MRKFSRRRLLAVLALQMAMMAAPALAAIPVRKTKGSKAPGAEASALAYLRAGKLEEAVAVLETATERELKLAAPSLRLFDLLATLYARKGRLGDLGSLASRVEAAVRGPRATAMLDRAAKWRNGHSKWRRDRASLQAIVRWRNARRDDMVIAA